MGVPNEDEVKKKSLNFDRGLTKNSEGGWLLSSDK